MKKLLLGALIALLPLTGFTATVLGFQAGAGIWSQTPSGSISSTIIGSDTLVGTEKDENYVYFSLEHAIPILPNFKYATTAATATGNLVNTVFDVDQTDATLYYEILDNAVSLDIGVTARKIDGVFTTGIGETFSGTIAMLYVAAEISLPAGFALVGEINTISSGSDNITDITAKLTYTTDFNLGIEVGTRKQSYDASIDTIQADIDISGLFAGVYFKF